MRVFHRALIGYILIIALLPLLALTLTVADLGSQIGTLAALSLSVTCAVLAYTICTSPVKIPRMSVVYGAILLPILGLISTGLSGWYANSLWGIGMEVGTAGSLLLFSSAVIAGTFISRDALKYVVNVFLVSVGISAAASALLVFLSPELLSDVGRTGYGPQLPLLIAAALLLASSILDSAREMRTKLLYGAFLLILSVEFCMFTSTAASALLGIFAGGLLLWRIICWLRHGSTVPVGTAVATIIAVIMFLFGGSAPIIQIGADIRPTWAATERIIGPQYRAYLPVALLGYGPNRVSVAWDRSRAMEFNVGPLWDMPVRYANSTVSTFLISLGLLGVFALLFGLLELVRAMWSRHGLSHRTGAVGPDTALDVAVATLFLYATFFLQNADIPLFLFAGAMLGLSVRAYTDDTETVTLQHVPRYALASLLVVLCIGSGWIAMRQGLAAYYYAQGNVELSIDIDSAAQLYEKAVRVWSTPLYAISAARTYIGIAADSSAARSDGEQQEEKFVGAITKSVQLANITVAQAPDDYPSLIFRASLYLSLLPIDFPDAAKEAQASIISAIPQAPFRPEAFFMQAQFDLASDNITAARESLKKALELKPDYENALKLQLRISPIQ